MVRVLAVHNAGVSKKKGGGKKTNVRLDDWAYKSHTKDNKRIVLCGVLPPMQVIGKQVIEGELVLDGEENKVSFVTESHLKWFEQNDESAPQLAIPKSLERLRQKTEFTLPKGDQEFLVSLFKSDDNIPVRLKLKEITYFPGKDGYTEEDIMFYMPVLEYEQIQVQEVPEC